MALAGLARVLVLNAGSSTLKWSVLEAGGALVKEGLENWDPAIAADRVRAVIGSAPGFQAVGHRVVHGGTRFRGAVRIDLETRMALGDLTAIDPLHMPAALAGIDAVSGALPAMPQVAAFDTAFHSTIPEAAGYALPFAWREEWGLKRFGFHGLSVAWSVRRAREMLGSLPRRMVVAHLGSGCSVTAVADGKSADTSMGFTPMEGLVMGTRSGSVDPGLLLYLLKGRGMSPAALDDALNHKSGLLGLSGISADLREVMAAAETGNARAILAYNSFILSVHRSIGSMMAVLGGLDALVFTGGIGEHSTKARTEIAGNLAFAGVQLDEAKNGAVGAEDASIALGGAVGALVVHAREDRTILEETLQLLQ